jgi:hypothetical protein
MKDIFSEGLSESQIQNLAAYFVTVPSEVGMKLWTVIGQGINDNVIALHGSTVDGRAISSHLVELMTGNSAEDK